MKNLTKVLSLSILLLPKSLFAVQAMGYMGMQLGVTQLQDNLDSQDSVFNILNPALITHNHNGIQTGLNAGLMVGGMIYGQKYSLGAELRLSHLEYNQTSILYSHQTNIVQHYGATQTTKFNNFHSVLAKLGAFILSDAMLYGHLGLGTVSTKVDYVQSLSNALVDYQATQDSHGKKNIGAILGVGLEILVSPQFSLYSDFNYSYFPSFDTKTTQTLDNLAFSFNQNLQQQLFQAVLGIKWHSRKSPRYIGSAVSGWHAGLNLGLLQSTLNAVVYNAPSQVFNFSAKNKFSSLSPNIDFILGKSWLTKQFAFFLESAAAIHPLDQNATLHFNGEKLLEASIKNTGSLSLQAKPGLVFYNRMLYAIAGIGMTHVNVFGDASWYTFYLSGWGIETPLANKLNLRAEYIFAFSNHTDHITKNGLEFTNKKFIQQKGTMGIVYYFS